MLDVTVTPRRFLPADFKVTDWDHVKPYADQLLARDITTREAFDNFMLDENEFLLALSEDKGWRYIRSSTHTDNDIAQQSYDQFVTIIDPPLADLVNQLNQKILASPFIEQPKDAAEALYFKRLKLKAKMFRAENVLLDTELDQLGTESDQIRGAMTIELMAKP